MNFEIWIKQACPGISFKAANAVLELSAEGATLPFIARYRKEKTGGLDEVAIQAVLDAKENYETVLKRQAYILDEIKKQDKLTDALKKKIESSFELSVLEDLYLPYKQKKKTKATLAKEAGLEPFANWLWDCGHGNCEAKEGETPDKVALAYINADKKINTAEDAIKGAQDILIERLSENADLKQKVRNIVFDKAFLHSEKGKNAKPHSKFEPYFEFAESVQRLMEANNSHRYLAIRRGWMEQELAIQFEFAPDSAQSMEEVLLELYQQEACTKDGFLGKDLLHRAARMALKVYVLSSIENEVHKTLRESADLAAITVFAENVKKLLLAAPFGSKAVLGVDPGIRTGCKLAVIDAAGKYVSDAVMHLNTEANKQAAAKGLLAVIAAYDIKAIAVGNGTAGRETESFVRKTLKDAGVKVDVTMVNESGASIYSASETAREEFPKLDVTVRGAISIARRLQDPLAELVKIEPKSIGVGQYQHDVSQIALKKRLDLVVDVCVNSVGVDLNTASYHLLSRVAGIGPGLAKTIVEHREKNGLFTSKQDLLKVSRFTEKTLEQAAGFLRIPQAKHPLDNTGVHPERYAVLTEVAEKMGQTLKSLMGPAGVKALRASEHGKNLKELMGEYTYEDVLKELEKPGRDPRESFAAFSYRDDISEVKDLVADMICPGIVTNVTNFGAFVDIGVHQDGLVHISQMSHDFVKDPRDVVSPGDHVTVKVMEVNLDKKQIALSMRLSEQGDHQQSHKQSAANSSPGRHKGPRKYNPGQRSGGSPAKPKQNGQAKATHNPFASLADFKVKK
ncbi:RNA-binding transcriptional accessory protein [bacterium]|nr:RNA-binding transcriptional accessory protein [bacterium]